MSSLASYFPDWFYGAAGTFGDVVAAPTVAAADALGPVVAAPAVSVNAIDNLFSGGSGADVSLGGDFGGGPATDAPSTLDAFDLSSLVGGDNSIAGQIQTGAAQIKDGFSFTAFPAIDLSPLVADPKLFDYPINLAAGDVIKAPVSSGSGIWGNVPRINFPPPTRTTNPGATNTTALLLLGALVVVVVVIAAGGGKK